VLKPMLQNHNEVMPVSLCGLLNIFAWDPCYTPHERLTDGKSPCKSNYLHSQAI
jgi:hypothetical protein